MDFIRDCELEKRVETIINQLLTPEASSKINFGIVKNADFISRLFISYKNHILAVNAKIKMLLGNEDCKRIVYADIAHEIGHVADQYYTGFKVLESKPDSEILADGFALPLLAKVYTNPREVMLQQIAHALHATLSDKNSTSGEIIFAKEIAEARTRALNCS